MKTSISVSHLDKMAFESEINGHKIVLDADEKVGGEDRGPRPKPLMLLALGGCTGMDVVSILKKMRVEFTDLNIRVEANLTDEHPRHYDKAHLIYEFSGDKIHEEKLKKAVSLSQERYCGVSFLYSKVIDLSYEIQVNGKKLEL